MGPDGDLKDLAGTVRRRAIDGVRGSLTLSLAMVPISFLTNIVLGRTSPRALGYYSAIQIFVGSYYTFLVFGGVYVFTRFVPGLGRRSRLSFALTYTTIVASVSAVTIATLFLALPEATRKTLARFGATSPALAVALLAVSLVWGFGSYFLFSILESTRATAVEKTVVVGFFLSAALGFGPLRDRLATDPATYLWWSALAVYASAALLAVGFVSRTEEARSAERVRWTLPRGFWPTVLYTHLDTIVNYVYTTLSPVLVLLWLDVASLGRLHAALRYVLVLSLLPGTMNSVIAPASARLDASGLRAEAFRQAGAAMRVAALVIVPMTVVLIFFADDAMALFGAEFRESGDVLRIAAVSLAAAPGVNLGSGLLAGLGAFRSYLVASAFYVAAALGATLLLVPLAGIRGAALALTLGALVRQLVIAFVLRSDLSFRSPSRLAAGWACVITSAAVALAFRPGRPLAAGLAAVIILVFCVAGGVTVGEIRAASSKVRRGAE